MAVRARGCPVEGRGARAVGDHPVQPSVRRRRDRYGRVPDAERAWDTVDLGVPQWDGVPVFSAWVGSVS